LLALCPAQTLVDRHRRESTAIEERSDE